MRLTIFAVLLSCLCVGCGGGGGSAGGGDPDDVLPQLPPVIGDGTFLLASEEPTPVGETPTAIGAGDFDGDGVVDLAVGAHHGDQIDILIGLGDGTFSAATPIPLPAGSRVFDMRVAHLDSGSTLDIAVSLSSMNTALVFHGAGDGSFTSGATLTVTGGVDAMGLEVADFDGNQTMDIAVVCRSPGLVGVFLGDGAGQFAAPEIFSVGFEARNLRAGTFDGDAHIDLAVSIRNSEGIELHLGKGDGTFESSATSPFPNNGYPWTMAAADFDDDGALDLVAAGENTGQMTVHQGDGAGSLTEAPGSPVPAGEAPIGLAVGDFNGDGFPDVVVADLMGDTLYIQINDSTGVFVPGPQPTIPVGLVPFALAVADFDGDSILDIAVANQNDNAVVVLIGNGRLVE